MNADKIDSGEGALFFRLCAQPLPYNIYPSIMSIDFYFFSFLFICSVKRENERIFYLFIFIFVFFFFSRSGDRILRERERCCVFISGANRKEALVSLSRSIAIDLFLSSLLSFYTLIDQCCTVYTVGSVPVFIRKMKLGQKEKKKKKVAVLVREKRKKNRSNSPFFFYFFFI